MNPPQRPRGRLLPNDARFLADLLITEAVHIGGYGIKRKSMAHTTREKAKLLNRVRRIRGQIEAVERALEAEKSCAQVMHLVAAARGAMNGFMAEIVEDHIRFHVSDP